MWKGIKFMGLAASQAKLLSITSRLSDNELRSQSITAAKMGLAHETAEASRKYINALNQNEFIYRTYDQNGEKCYVPCTGMQLSTYGPLKNQYCLVNTKGQVMVSELDGANYQDSKDINEFLAHYGIDAVPTGEYKQVENPEYADGYTEWKKGYDEWMAGKPDKDDEKYWELKPTSGKNTELYDKFISAVQQCGCWWGENNIASFYHIEHILAKMIDYDTDFTAYPGTPKEVTYHKLPGSGDYTTSSGVRIYDIQGGSITEGNPWAPSSEAIMVEVRDKIKNGHKDPDLWQDLVNMYYEVCKTQGLLEYINAANNGEPAMSTSDIEYEVYDANEADGWDSLIERLKYAFDEDEWVFNEELYEDDLGEWKSHEPEPYDVPRYLDEEILEYEDKDQAQWYVNLWHRMNGPSQQKDGMMSYTDETNVTTTEYGTEFTGTSTTVTNTFEGTRWYVLEDGLMNSQDWLKYALETGAVSLERVNFTNPTETGTGLKDATWTSIIYTNALDISEQQNEKAITIAEAEYEQKSKEIENKDKQYDSMLKLLDTEHSALLQELETAKTVITKNTERTLKMYSA